MNSSFVNLAVYPETREDLRFIAEYNETSISKLIRRLAREEKEKILSKKSINGNKKIKITTKGAAE